MLAGSLRSYKSITRSYSVLLSAVLHRDLARLYTRRSESEKLMLERLLHTHANVETVNLTHYFSSLFESDAAGSYVFCYLLRAATPHALQYYHLSSGCFRSQR